MSILTQVLKTPSSDTGFNAQNLTTGYKPIYLPESPLEALLDFTTGTITLPSYQAFRSFVGWLGDVCDDPWIFHDGEPKTIGKRWDNWAESAAKALLCWSVFEGQYHCWLSLPGGCLTKRIGLLDSWLLVRGLFTRGFKFTRLDPKARDHSKTVTPELCLEAAKVNNVTGFNPFSKSGLEVCENYHNGVAHITVYCGSKDSDSRIRVYNALEQHGIDATDYEHQMRDEKAHEAARILSELPLSSDEQTVSLVVASLAMGQVDFIDRENNNGRSDRAERLPWWQKVMNFVGDRFRVTVPKFKPTIERSIAWIQKQVAQTLATIKIALGPVKFNQLLSELIVKGKQNISSQQRLSIIDYQRSQNPQPEFPF